MSRVKPCTGCSGNITRHKRHSEKQWNNVKYCSLSCRSKFIELRRTKDCKICGQQFVVRKRPVEKAITCSRSCAAKNLYKGTSPLDKEIRRAFSWWREAVFERDNYTCQICWTRGVEIQADHIIPFSYLLATEDYGAMADLDNGRTLCVPCHRNTNTWGNRINKNSVAKQWDALFKGE